MEVTPKFVPSLTLKEITGIEDFSKMIPKVSQLIALIQGRVTGYKMEQSQFEPQIVCYGDFQGIDTLTGQVTISETAYLPKKLSQKIAAELDRGDGLEVKETNFETGISIQPSKRAALKYRFVAHPVPNERLAERASGLTALYTSVKALQIEAPKK